MGYMQHHAIVVTSFDKVKLYEAHGFACDTSAKVSDVVESNINGYHSFMVAPDGSKSGWSESDAGDAARDKIKAWLRAQRFEDGSSVLQWVEVLYGDDEWECRVVDDGDADRRNAKAAAAADRREG